ncbi:MAG: hypothetical protein WBN22_05385 [Verrucomicrobiia bacterium]
MAPDFAINATVKKVCKRGKEPKQKVVLISTSPGGRNSGKNEANILFQNDTRAADTHEKMGGKIWSRYEQDFLSMNITEQDYCARTQLNKLLPCAYSLPTRYPCAGASR